MAEQRVLCRLCGFDLTAQKAWYRGIDHLIDEHRTQLIDAHRRRAVRSLLTIIAPGTRTLIR